MKQGLLTARQKEVLRYRKQGLTQQAIADICHTSKANICRIEQSARRRISQSRAAIDAYNTLDARPVCTIRSGSDLFDAIAVIYREAAQARIPLPADPLVLINRIREAKPEQIHGRYVKTDIGICLSDTGELFFT
jgi:HTH-type transcriptional regulator, fmd operon transcriptional regulator